MNVMHTQIEMCGPKRLSSTVIDAVADHEGIDPMTLEPPLYEAIDPDAIDSLFPRDANGRSPSSGRLSFSYNDYRITVTSDGDVQVTEPDET